MARPAGFDRAQVPEQAVQAFWDKGYCATSMAGPTAATELGPGGICAAFKSKEGLFLAALDHYGAQGARSVRRTLASAGTPLNGIRAFFRQLSANASRSRTPRAAVSASTPHLRSPAATRGYANASITTWGRQRRCFGRPCRPRGKAANCRGRRTPRRRAAFIMTKLWGPRVLMAAGGDPQRVQIVVEQLLAALDGAGTEAGGKAAVAEDPSLSERIDLSHTPNERTANP